MISSAFGFLSATFYASNWTPENVQEIKKKSFYQLCYASFMEVTVRALHLIDFSRYSTC